MQISDYDEAVASGAARYKAADLMELSQRTLKRWRRANGVVKEDQRPQAERVVQPHQLTHAEEAAILDTCNEQEYQSLPPSQIVLDWLIKGFIWRLSLRFTECSKSTSN
jgi:putative transposase